LEGPPDLGDCLGVVQRAACPVFEAAESLSDRVAVDSEFACRRVDAQYERQKRNQGVAEVTQIPNRGHALTIDAGWREVAQTALDFIKRFV
jgi:hypothetical protein